MHMVMMVSKKFYLETDPMCSLTAVVQHLLDAGASLYDLDSQGRTPLTILMSEVWYAARYTFSFVILLSHLFVYYEIIIF